MPLSDILSVDGVFPGLAARCKREALTAIAERAAPLVGAPATTIEEALSERERLGSTGVGDGVAIPHGKLSGLDGIVGLFAQFDRPVEFDAVDGEPVDLMFVLLAPESASAGHLKALARVSRLLRNAQTREALRRARSAEALHAIVADAPNADAA